MTIVSMAVLGRLLVWVLQTSGPTKRFWDLHPFLQELGECDFCTGCWVYTILAIMLDVNLTAPIYAPIASEVITGVTFAFVAHLATVGWRTKWGYEVLE